MEYKFEFGEVFKLKANSTKYKNFFLVGPIVHVKFIFDIVSLFFDMVSL
jgi:hypothetical protein